MYLKSPQILSVPNGALDGVTFNPDGSTTFVLHAPYKKNVFLIGDFNQWKIDNSYLLNRSGEGDDEKWWITLNSLNSDQIYRFQYIVDGSIRIADPYSETILEPDHT